jgi:hypothetical protein
MSKNLYRPQLWLVALAALALSACSSTTDSTQASNRPTSAPTVTVTATPAPAPVTVTSAPAAAPTTVVVQSVANGPTSFRSPSGNINCRLSTPGGDISARCEVVEHSWQTPPPPNCHMNSGDRFYLTQGGEAGFGCYGQEFPPVDETLAYGQSRSFGSITCASEYSGVTCTDSSTGHYFRVSRDSYQLG